MILSGSDLSTHAARYVRPTTNIVSANWSFAHAGLIIDRATQRIRIARISSPGGKE
jgi:hypothetical protein